MKALQLLRTFSKKDWHWFEKFLKSPAFNQNNRLLAWFLAIKKQKDKIDTKSDFFFDKSIPDAALERSKEHHQSNYFLKTTEQYLAWDEWQSDETAQLLFLLSACRKRGADRHFKTVHQRLEQQLEQQPLRNPQYLRWRYSALHEEYQQGMEAGRTDAVQLQALSDWQDAAFAAEKLRNGCMLLSRRKILKTEFDTGLLVSVLAFVEARPALLEYPAIAAYYHGYLALSRPEEEGHFFALKALLGRVERHFPVHELRDIYLLCVNFCINRINLRQNNYLRELLNLYQAGLEAGVFLENGQISRFTYTNIALLALRMKEFDWVLRFIEHHRPLLPEAQREATYGFNLARYYCETGDYNRAMPLLQTIDFDDVLHQLMAKTMLLRMYYETGELSALSSLLSSFSTFLRRKGQVAEQQKTAYLNTIRFVRKLTALRPGDRRLRTALRNEIRETPLVAEKDWLLGVMEP